MGLDVGQVERPDAAHFILKPLGRLVGNDDDRPLVDDPVEILGRLADRSQGLFKGHVREIGLKRDIPERLVENDIDPPGPAQGLKDRPQGRFRRQAEVKRPFPDLELDRKLDFRRPGFLLRLGRKGLLGLEKKGGIAGIVAHGLGIGRGGRVLLSQGEEAAGLIREEQAGFDLDLGQSQPVHRFLGIHEGGLLVKGDGLIPILGDFRPNALVIDGTDGRAGRGGQKGEDRQRGRFFHGRSPS
ncbi:MAG: hypothetical protein BWX98_02644 [Candidatus Aminicenantes bacterium ADurb.Bin147]|nr:MAG: hypothetical protein BWX98_02644 [Candidatus Aminicenantes bacterium ADurb.Bin147]